MPAARHMLCAHRPSRQQQGFTLVGLLGWAFVVTFSALILIRVVPTIAEYSTIRRVVSHVAREGGSTVSEIRSAFDRAKMVENSIHSISGQDLDITKENDRIVVRFAYDTEIPVMGPVSLLIKYRGQSQ